MYTTRFFFFSISKAEKISVYCIFVMVCNIHVPQTPSMYITGSLFFEVYEFGRFYGTSVPELPLVVPPIPRGKGWRFKEKCDSSV